MENFALEIFLMLLAAFAIGCVIGHVARGLVGQNEDGRIGSHSGRGARPARQGAAGRKTAKKSRKKPSRDDLTQIKGIGPAIEKKLNRLGIKRFEQIAKWDLADVAVIDQRLAFKGRIEREGWISQARKLASRRP